MQYIHENYGSLPWYDLLQPAIRVARDGWRVNEDLVNYMDSGVASAGRNFLVDDPQWARDFAPNGTRLALNDTIRRVRYAKTLQAIAVGGPDEFYEGPIAETMIASLRGTNGTMTLEDLKNYEVAVRNITQINYRGYKISSIGAPGGGPVALAALKILEQYGSVEEVGINLTTHRLDESLKFAYGMVSEHGQSFTNAGKKLRPCSAPNSAILSSSTAWTSTSSR